ncbi:hypothetical protein [Pseudorhodoplanes sp.]|uniref:hypothetical protein n=1 Tax=Pseudorhodoplanes sp. TaxID=1934341 RepID=UPI002CDB8574|nr:hypothetical protein [Pseudorhodoplanes sp.]HWV51656.1 hypothetical protein [Pseudorhodoplanes sp.]
MTAAAMRLGQLAEADIVSAAVNRLKKNREPAVLIGALEGLKLSALDRDAEAFKRIADKHGIAARFYFLISIVMLLGDEKYTGSKLEVLAKVRDEFFAQRGKDFRKELLAAIDDELFGEIVAHIKSFQSTFVFLRSMAGLELGTKLSRLTALSATLDGVASSELASALMIAEDISLDLVRVLVSDLGGPESLMGKHWRETPWALQPTITQGDDGEVEVHADILAVEGELTRKPDSIVFDYAARMLAFFPDAQRITSRPVQVTGLPITINGFSQGVKSFPRRNSSSQATITWNRLLLYAVALRYESGSTTDVMQRRKESLEIAATRLVLHADRRCRGQRLTSRQEAELQALDLLQDFFPRLPMDKPEIALGLNKNPEFSDPSSDLIADIASACRRIYDGSVDGCLLASDMEGIAKGAKTSQEDKRWSYIGGAPDDALIQIEETASGLREVFHAVSKQGGVPSSLVMMPSHQMWGKGTGLNRARERAKTQHQRKLAELKQRLDAALSAEGTKVRTTCDPSIEDKKRGWPDCDVCVLVECQTYLEFLQWLDGHAARLQSESQHLNSLMVAPVMKGRVSVSCALHVMSSVGVLPAPEFEARWSNRIKGVFFDQGAAIRAFDEAFGNMLSFYAARELLSGKVLHDVEQAHIERAGELTTQASDRFQSIISDRPTELGALSAKFLSDLNGAFATDDKPADARPAVELARQLFSGLGDNQQNATPTDIQSAILGVRMALIEFHMMATGPIGVG